LINAVLGAFVTDRPAQAQRVGLQPPDLSDAGAPEVSIVMPCLNEADTLATCIQKAQRALHDHGIAGEIIVADNGSSDGSQAIAERLGARVVSVEAKGYGSALMGGLAAARGRFLIMGDADDSYDFLEIPNLLGKLREGYDLVQGCRLPAGGGKVLPGAMPFSHRWFGNPMFSLLVRQMFWSQIDDVYCGLRGFTREFYDSLDQRCTGMEFATEMMVKAGIYRAHIAQVPITLHPDGRKAHPPHLKTFRDGWRTLRFLLLYSPRWLFWYPGVSLIGIGIVGYVLALPGVKIGPITLDAHTLLVASLSILLGFQAMVFAVFAKSFAVSERLLPPDARLEKAFQVVTLERGVIGGGLAIAVGLALILAVVNQWRLSGFGPLDYAHTMRWVIPGVTLTTLGFQAILSSFFISILTLRRR
jgi:glycosyltransferase involved in cell wall biosynthesis